VAAAVHCYSFSSTPHETKTHKPHSKGRHLPLHVRRRGDKTFFACLLCTHTRARTHAGMRQTRTRHHNHTHPRPPPQPPKRTHTHTPPPLPQQPPANDDDSSGDSGKPDRFLGTAIDCLNQCYPLGRRARVLVFLTGAPWGPGDERECCGFVGLWVWVWVGVNV
jgi:hypothetical protein